MTMGMLKMKVKDNILYIRLFFGVSDELPPFTTVGNRGRVQVGLDLLSRVPFELQSLSKSLTLATLKFFPRTSILVFKSTTLIGLTSLGSH